MRNSLDVCTKIISNGESFIDSVVQTEAWQCYACISADVNCTEGQKVCSTPGQQHCCDALR